MFDYVRSSFNLGDDLTDVELQTKDLVCLMEDYWISPAGELFTIDYSDVSDLIPEPDSTNKFFPYKSVPNGNHGKVTPSLHTGDVRLYRSNSAGNFVEITVTFLKGKVYELSTPTLLVNERQYNELVAKLEEAPQVKPGLKALFTRPSPFDETPREANQTPSTETTAG
jgi:hypothetical protein